MDRECERCRVQPEGQYGLHDYCAHCSKNLCPNCMGEGCCGHVPAHSGMMEEDKGDFDAAAGHMQ